MDNEEQIDPSQDADVPPAGQVAPAPDGMASGSPSPASTTVTVPLSALASPGEDEQMQTPAVGDLVQFQYEGKIASVQGDNAVVALESVNGKPLTDKAAATHDTQPAGDDEFAQLKQEAAQGGAM